jgi:hypothetical protein
LVATIVVDVGARTFADPDAGANILVAMVLKNSRRRITAPDPSPKIVPTVITRNLHLSFISNPNPPTHVSVDKIILNDRLTGPNNSYSGSAISEDNTITNHRSNSANRKRWVISLYSDGSFIISKIFASFLVVPVKFRLVEFPSSRDCETVDDGTFKQGNYRRLTSPVDHSGLCPGQSDFSTFRIPSALKGNPGWNRQLSPIPTWLKQNNVTWFSRIKRGLEIMILPGSHDL